MPEVPQTTLDSRWTGHKLGFTCHTGDLGWEELIEWVQAAEGLGYSAFCTTEESGKDAFAVLAVLARETKTISLGTAIVNFYSRMPTLLPMLERSRRRGKSATSTAPPSSSPTRSSRSSAWSAVPR